MTGQKGVPPRPELHSHSKQHERPVPLSSGGGRFSLRQAAHGSRPFDEVSVPFPSQEANHFLAVVPAASAICDFCSHRAYTLMIVLISPIFANITLTH